jgi:Laminin EGF domain
MFSLKTCILGQVKSCNAWLANCDPCMFCVWPACNCDPKGTENNDVNNCDLYTGQCRCKSKQLTSGLHCDKCAEFAYMNDEFGCAACDQCSTVGSYGTCKPGKFFIFIFCIHYNWWHELSRPLVSVKCGTDTVWLWKQRVGSLDTLCLAK